MGGRPGRGEGGPAAAAGPSAAGGRAAGPAQPARPAQPEDRAAAAHEHRARRRAGPPSNARRGLLPGPARRARGDAERRAAEAAARLGPLSRRTPRPVSPRAPAARRAAGPGSPPAARPLCSRPAGPGPGRGPRAAGVEAREQEVAERGLGGERAGPAGGGGAGAGPGLPHDLGEAACPARPRLGWRGAAGAGEVLGGLGNRLGPAVLQVCGWALGRRPRFPTDKKLCRVASRPGQPSKGCQPSRNCVLTGWVPEEPPTPSRGRAPGRLGPERGMRGRGDLFLRIAVLGRVRGRARCCVAGPLRSSPGPGGLTALGPLVRGKGERVGGGLAPAPQLTHSSQSSVLEAQGGGPFRA